MADENVRAAQHWVNETYKGVRGYRPVDENGRTGWPTLYALTRALQHELGISELSDNFGDETLARLTDRWPVVDGDHGPANVVKIVQSGLYCKGYPGDEISGEYHGETADSVGAMKADMGVDHAYPGDGVTPKVFKALLTTDAYERTGDGTTAARKAQQWLNGTYVKRRDFFIGPCDGNHSRTTQHALILGVQYELGMDDDTANGNFGPQTQEGVKQHAILNVGDSDTDKHFVHLFQAAMILNLWAVPLDGDYTQDVADQVVRYQRFAHLEPAHGTADFQTWASLLVSTGDAARKGTACDTDTEITEPRARALQHSGYTIVARYLSNSPRGGLDKKLQDGELRRITTAGLSVVPLFETDGDSAHYFSSAQGTADARGAMDPIRKHGFSRDAVVYFAVDFDVLEGDLTDRVIPYFKALNRRLRFYGSPLQVGVYGPRATCARLAKEDLVKFGFLADRSTGWQGNAGEPLPRGWAFDQIRAVTVGDGSGRVGIDVDIASGRDDGWDHFDPPDPDGPRLDERFDSGKRDSLLGDVNDYLKSIGVGESTVYCPNDNAESLDTMLRHDDLITGLARAFRMRKSLIQCPIFWEIRKLTYQDPVADNLVTAYYRYKEAYEAWEKLPWWGKLGSEPPQPPLVVREDDSTGLGQIFAATAIKSHNYAVETGLIVGRKLDADDWHDMWDVWQQLHNDDEYNVATVPLVHRWGAHDIGVTAEPLSYTDDDTRRVLARYNGVTQASEEYGRQLFGLYRVFEKYNAAER